MPIAVIMPKLEMSQETALIVEWLKNEGDQVKKGDLIMTVETDKVTVEIESPGDGILHDISAKAGETVPVTTVIANIYAPNEVYTEPIQKTEKVDDATFPQKLSASIKSSATPLAVKMAKAEGIDLAGINGSGLNKKIIKSDIELASNEKRRASPAARHLAVENGLSLNEIQGTGPLGRIQGHDVRQAAIKGVNLQNQSLKEPTVIPLNGMRRTIAERMQASYQTAPHINFTSRVDLTGLQEMRKIMNEQSKRENRSHISLTVLFVRIVASVLKKHPWINSSLREDEILLLKNINIGVAVSLSNGLIVPVIQDADTKGIGDLAQELTALVDRAHQNKLQPADVSGGTFTISNLGSFGVEQFNAIINPGQAAILAISSSQPEVVPVDGIMEIRPILRMTLSADHRIIDGAVAAQFMMDLKNAMECPSLILW